MDLKTPKPLKRETGHEKLIRDVNFLKSESETFQFHDFKNSKYAAPKIMLVRTLTKMLENAKHGEYDNDTRDEND